MSRPLIIALHGVGSSADNLAAALAPLASVAEVVALDGCEPFDGGGRTRQWFSVAGVTEADRPLRVAGALPSLLRRLDRLASERDVRRDDVVLLGFSQGAIMTLAAVAQGLHRGCAVAVAGRLATPVVHAADPATVLLLHDDADPVMPAALSTDAAARLRAAGHRVTLTRTHGIGHTIGPATLAAIDHWLAETASAPLSPTLIEG